MGRGDKRSKKGKITIGSYGVSRPRPSALAKAAKDKSIAEAKPKVKKAAKAEASADAAAPKVKKAPKAKKAE